MHYSGCVSFSLPVVDDVAAQVAAEDGYRPPRGASEIRHPSMARTRRYLAANPLPTQQDRRAS
ncbi:MULTISPECIES: hypothetical protein [unclassified Streptomyces]|uniref:hypothetical protein n=1 Tax=unclassified Streptomyces TaxID=2593676 RepID=UPI0033D4164B